MGVVTSNPFSSPDPLMQWGTAEAYGVARQSTGAYVTAGYGRSAASGSVNVLSFRYSATGVFDTNYAVSGIFEKDLASLDDRGRNIIALPDDRLFIAGSATPTTSQVDGMVMILTANGALDTTFNTTGYKTYKFDATNDRPDEALYGVAVSPNGMFAAAAGYPAPRAPSPRTTNDDAVLVIIPLGGTGTEFAAAVPFSTTAERPLLGGHLRRQQQDRRGGLRHRGDRQRHGGRALQHRRHARQHRSARAASPRINATRRRHRGRGARRGRAVERQDRRRRHRRALVPSVRSRSGGGGSPPVSSRHRIRARRPAGPPSLVVECV